MKPRSSVRSATRSCTASELPTKSVGSTAGKRALNLPISRGSTYSPIVMLAPMRSGPAASAPISFRRFSSSADSPRMRSAYSNATCPAGVRTMRPCARSKSRVLRCSSSCLIWKVTAGCVMKSVSAALVNDRCFATAWNTWRRRSAMRQILRHDRKSGTEPELIQGRSPNCQNRVPACAGATTCCSVDDVVDRRLLHGPLATLAVVAREGEAVPVLVIQPRMVAAVVVARPACFFAEHGVARHGLRSDQAMVQLPHALQLVQVLGGHVAHVLLEHGEELEAALEQLAVGHVRRADAADVLVHDLFQPLQPVDRQQVARRYRAADDLVAADAEVLERLVDLALEVAVLLLPHLRLAVLQVVNVLDRRLACDAAFGEGARGELVCGAANGVAGAEKAVDRHHAVVAPLVIGRGIVLRAARPCA